MAKKIRNRQIASAETADERSKLIDLKDKQERAAKKAHDAAIKRANEENAKVKDAIAKVAKTPEGRILLRTLRNSCGVDSFHCIQNQATGEVPKDLMLINDSKRDLWIELKQLIPVKELIMIEHNIDKVIDLAE